MFCAIVSSASLIGFRRLQVSGDIECYLRGGNGSVADRRLKPFLVSPCHVCVKQCVDIMLQIIVYHYKSSNKKHGRRRLPLLSRRGGNIISGGGTQYNRNVCWPLFSHQGERGTRDERKNKLTGDEVGGGITAL